MKSMYMLCLILFIFTGCTFYDINVNVLAPEKGSRYSHCIIEVNIHDNNDSDTPTTTTSASGIPTL